jgi:integrase
VLIIRNKGRKPCSVPLNTATREVIEVLLNDATVKDYLFINERTGKPLTEIKRGFLKACELAGIDDFTFHDLRHTFSTRLKEVGFDSATRRDLMGHTNQHGHDERLYAHACRDPAAGGGYAGRPLGVEQNWNKQCGAGEAPGRKYLI